MSEGFHVHWPHDHDHALDHAALYRVYGLGTVGTAMGT
jgi:hypothetical protein